MRQKKCLKELTIKDNFMFGAVMSDAENCRRFLEMAAGFSIERVEVIKEKSMVYLNLGLGSGERTLFLSTAGENEEDEPEELVQFLKYVKADLEESESSFEDEYVQTLQKAVRHVKESRELEEKFMVLEEMLQDEREEGKIEGREEGRTEGRALAVIELLETIGEVPQSLREKILGQTDTSVLSRWLKLAARAQSIEQFEKNL